MNIATRIIGAFGLTTAGYFLDAYATSSDDIAIFASSVSTGVVVLMCLVAAGGGISVSVEVVKDSESIASLKRIRGLSHLPFFWLVASAYFVIVMFATVYVYIARFIQGSFNVERLDGVAGWYFGIMTFATVGYGDIVPVSKLARVLVGIEVLISMAFVIFIFAIISIHLSSVIRPSSDKGT